MGTRERRLREAEARRQSILQAARKLFWKQGFEATTMPQLARACELAPGTLYLYFPSKGSLYVELLMEGYDHLLKRLQSIPRKGTRTEKLSALFDTFIQFAREEAEYFRIMFFVLQSETQGTRDTMLDADQMRRLVSGETLCRQAAAAFLNDALPGELPSAADTVDALYAMLAGMVFFWARTEDFDRVAQETKRLLLASFTP